MKIAAIVPCYKASRHISDLFCRFGPEVDRIYVVDDKCPEETGKKVQSLVKDPRIVIIFNDVNLGVGGAVLAGIERAYEDGFDIAVKIDGDGQMDPALIEKFTRPIAQGLADYTKGNRFFMPQSLKDMPKGRLIGNAVLSFASKFSTGYWNIFDPTNGYIALDLRLYPLMETEKVSKRYFFETDLLFRAGLIKAKVVDIPMYAKYAEEKSNLVFRKEAPIFLRGHLRNFVKRIFYDYFLRDFSAASVELIIGTMALVFGIIYGIVNFGGDEATPPGTVMISALPIIVGMMLLISFLNYDIQKTPSTPLTIRL